MWDQARLEREYKTSYERGLSDSTARELLTKVGLNQLTDKKKTPKIILFLKEQTGFFSLILWFGAFLCFIAHGIYPDKTDKSNLFLGCVLAIFNFITGVFSYYQSSKAASLMDDFKNFIPRICQVVRDG